MGGILGAIWSKFPGIPRNLPKFSPGRPRVPPGKHPPEFRAFYRAFWGFTPRKGAVFPARGVARGPRGVHRGKSRGFWGGPGGCSAVLSEDEKAGNSAKNRPKIGQIWQNPPNFSPGGFRRTPRNPPKIPPIFPRFALIQGGFAPPENPRNLQKV